MPVQPIVPQMGYVELHNEELKKKFGDIKFDIGVANWDELSKKLIKESENKSDIKLITKETIPAQYKNRKGLEESGAFLGNDGLFYILIDNIDDVDQVIKHEKAHKLLEPFASEATNQVIPEDLEEIHRVTLNNIGRELQADLLTYKTFGFPKNITHDLQYQLQLHLDDGIQKEDLYNIVDYIIGDNDVPEEWKSNWKALKQNYQVSGIKPIRVNKYRRAAPTQQEIILGGIMQQGQSQGTTQISQPAQPQQPPPPPVPPAQPTQQEIILGGITQQGQAQGTTGATPSKPPSQTQPVQPTAPPTQQEIVLGELYQQGLSKGTSIKGAETPVTQKAIGEVAGISIPSVVKQDIYKEVVTTVKPEVKPYDLMTPSERKEYDSVQKQKMESATTIFSTDGKTVAINGKVYGIGTPLGGQFEYYDASKGHLVTGAYVPVTLNQGINQVSPETQTLIDNIIKITGCSYEEAVGVVNHFVNGTTINGITYTGQEGNALVNRYPELQKYQDKVAGKITEDFYNGIPLVATQEKTDAKGNPTGQMEQRVVLISFNEAQKLSKLTPENQFAYLRDMGVYPTSWEYKTGLDAKGKPVGYILQQTKVQEESTLQLQKVGALDSNGNLDLQKAIDASISQKTLEDAGYKFDMPDILTVLNAGMAIGKIIESFTIAQMKTFSPYYIKETKSYDIDAIQKAIKDEKLTLGEVKSFLGEGTYNNIVEWNKKADETKKLLLDAYAKAGGNLEDLETAQGDNQFMLNVINQANERALNQVQNETNAYQKLAPYAISDVDITKWADLSGMTLEEIQKLVESNPPTQNLQSLAKFQRDNPDDKETIVTIYGSDVYKTVQNYNTKLSNSLNEIDNYVNSATKYGSLGIAIDRALREELGIIINPKASSVDIVNGVAIYRDANGKVMDDLDILKSKLEQLTPEQKEALANKLGTDYNKGSTLAEINQEILQAQKESGLLGSMVFTPITGVLSAPTKQLTLNEARTYLNDYYKNELLAVNQYRNKDGTIDINKLQKDVNNNPQLKEDILKVAGGYKNFDDLKTNLEGYNNGIKVTGLEWAESGAMAVLDVLMLGGGEFLASAGLAGRLIGGGITLGSAGVFMPSTIKTVKSTDVSTGEKILAIGGEVLLIGGGALGLKGGKTTIAGEIPVSEIKGITSNVDRAVKIANNAVDNALTDVSLTGKVPKATVDVATAIKNIPQTIEKGIISLNDGLEKINTAIEKVMSGKLGKDITIEIQNAARTTKYNLINFKTLAVDFAKYKTDVAIDNLNNGLQNINKLAEYIMEGNIGKDIRANFANAVYTTKVALNNLNGLVKYKSDVYLDGLNKSLERINTLAEKIMSGDVSRVLKSDLQNAVFNIKQGLNKASDFASYKSDIYLEKLNDYLDNVNKFANYLMEGKLTTEIKAELQNFGINTKQLIKQTGDMLAYKSDIYLEKFNEALENINTVADKVMSGKYANDIKTVVQDARTQIVDAYKNITSKINVEQAILKLNDSLDNINKLSEKIMTGISEFDLKQDTLSAINKAKMMMQDLSNSLKLQYKLGIETPVKIFKSEFEIAKFSKPTLDKLLNFKEAISKLKKLNEDGKLSDSELNDQLWKIMQRTEEIKTSTEWLRAKEQISNVINDRINGIQDILNKYSTDKTWQQVLWDINKGRWIQYYSNTPEVIAGTLTDLRLAIANNDPVKAQEATSEIDTIIKQISDKSAEVKSDLNQETIRQIEADWQKGKMMPFGGSVDDVIESIVSGKRNIGTKGIVGQLTPEELTKVKNAGLEVTSHPTYDDVIHSPKATKTEIQELFDALDYALGEKTGNTPRENLVGNIRLGKAFQYTDNDIAFYLREHALSKTPPWTLDDIARYVPEWYKAVTGKDITPSSMINNHVLQLKEASTDWFKVQSSAEYHKARIEQLKNELKTNQSMIDRIDKELSAVKPEVAPKLTELERVRILDQISKDNIALSELSGRVDYANDIAKIQQRISDNYSKLASNGDISGDVRLRQLRDFFDNEIKRIQNAIDTLSKEKTLKEISKLEEVEKILDDISKDENELNNAKDLRDKSNNPERKDRLDEQVRQLERTIEQKKTAVQEKVESPVKFEEEWERLLREAEERETGKYGIEKVEKTETAIEPKITTETAVEKIIETEKSPAKIEQTTPEIKEKPISAPSKVAQPSSPETKPFSIPESVGEPYWALVWENGVVTSKQMKPEALPKGYIYDITSPNREAIEKRLSELLKSMTLEQALKIISEEYTDSANYPLTITQTQLLQQIKTQTPPVISPVTTPEIFPAPVIAPAPQPQPVPIPQPQPSLYPQPTPIEVAKPVPAPFPFPMPEPLPKPLREPLTDKELITKKPMPLDESSMTGAGGKKVKIPYGSLAHRQGNHWGYVTTEELAKPGSKKEIIWLKEGEIPEGAWRFATGKGSAYKTLQVIPQGARLPTDEADIDMGWATIHVKQDIDGNLSMDFTGGKEAVEERWAQEEQDTLDQQQLLERSRQPQVIVINQSGQVQTPETVVQKQKKVIAEDNVGKSLNKQLLPEYSQGDIKVYSVDDAWIRNEYADKSIGDRNGIDFVLAGHNLVYYDLIPKDEVWVSQYLLGNDREAVIIHELAEYNKMKEDADKKKKEHLTYDEYSDIHSEVANPVEIEVRKNPEKAPELLEEQLGYNPEEVEIEKPDIEMAVEKALENYEIKKATHKIRKPRNFDKIMEERWGNDEEIENAPVKRIRRNRRTIGDDSGLKKRYYLGHELPDNGIGY